jgi:hypothetical protein
MSPHEMSSQRVEEIVQEFNELLEDSKLSYYHNYYRGQLEQYEQLLKERAEAGTY